MASSWRRTRSAPWSPARRARASGFASRALATEAGSAFDPSAVATIAPTAAPAGPPRSDPRAGAAAPILLPCPSSPCFDSSKERRHYSAFLWPLTLELFGFRWHRPRHRRRREAVPACCSPPSPHRRRTTCTGRRPP
ncbi:hypothetical protein WP1_196 [Pseudomonas phage WP1]